MDNIIAALEHNDRVYEIKLWQVSVPLLENVLAAMKESFPALTYLNLRLDDGKVAVVPDSFLGGSAPRLRSLVLQRLSIPGLPKLLLSATDLVDLLLLNIPHSMYIPPGAMVTCLLALVRLEGFGLGFESPRSRPERRHPPPHNRSILSTITNLWFTGVSEYLEDLLSRIDAPLLNSLNISFFHQLIFDSPQLAHFIGRSPALKAHDLAHVFFADSKVQVILPWTELKLGISCRQSDWQLSSLAQVCTSSFPQALIQTVEQLYLREHGDSRSRWQDDIEDNQWLELLRPFTAVKSLYLSKKFAPRIAPFLQDLVVRERVMEVLPSLQRLCMERLHPSGPVKEAIERFVAARLLSNHPIVISLWDKSAFYASQAREPNANFLLGSSEPPATLHWILLPFGARRSKGKLKFDFAYEVDEVVLAEAGGSRPLSVLERNKSAAEPGLTEMVIHCAELPEWPVHVARQSGIRCVDVFEAIRDTYNVVLTTTERSIHQSRVRDIERRRPPPPEGAKKGARRRDLLGGKTQFLGLDWSTSDVRYPNGCWRLNVGSSPA